VLAYGNFLTILLNFLILAFIIFQMVRLMNRMRATLRPEEEAAARRRRRRKTSCCCAKSAIPRRKR
jgi:large-conductance mechanosensitive channel